MSRTISFTVPKGKAIWVCYAGVLPDECAYVVQFGIPNERGGTIWQDFTIGGEVVRLDNNSDNPLRLDAPLTYRVVKEGVVPDDVSVYTIYEGEFE